MAVWKAAKLYLRRRVNLRKIALVGGVAVLGIGAAGYAVSRSGE
jgi:hypothetical protein